jgi:hypothetical protein
MDIIQRRTRRGRRRRRRKKKKKEEEGGGKGLRTNLHKEVAKIIHLL